MTTNKFLTSIAYQYSYCQLYISICQFLSLVGARTSSPRSDSELFYFSARECFNINDDFINSSNVLAQNIRAD